MKIKCYTDDEIIDVNGYSNPKSTTGLFKIRSKFLKSLDINSCYDKNDQFIILIDESGSNNECDHEKIALSLSALFTKRKVSNAIIGFSRRYSYNDCKEGDFIEKHYKGFNSEKISREIGTCSKDYYENAEIDILESIKDYFTNNKYKKYVIMIGDGRIEDDDSISGKILEIIHRNHYIFSYIENAHRNEFFDKTSFIFDFIKHFYRREVLVPSNDCIDKTKIIEIEKTINIVKELRGDELDDYVYDIEDIVDTLHDIEGNILNEKKPPIYNFDTQQFDFGKEEEPSRLVEFTWDD